MLEVGNLAVSYGRHQALAGATVAVRKGEIVVILGANGAGKSTLLRAVAGLSEGEVKGDITVDGQPILGLPSHRIVERGIAMVPEGRGVFADLTVHENLLLGAYTPRARRRQAENLAQVLQLFPKLETRRNQVVRTMSGGEQKMVAIGRAIMSAPDILMLDEPSLGLSPKLCKELFRNLASIRNIGLGVLLVEQNAKQSLAIADRGYLLENGQIVGEDTAANLMNDPAVQKAYLGGAQATATGAVAAAGGSAQATAGQVDVGRLAISTGAGFAPRKTADQLIHGSIDELVRHAAHLQAEFVRAGHSRAGMGGTAFGGAPGDDLQRALRQIESAAARSRAGGAVKGAPAAPRPDRPHAAGHEEDLPDIEVYRKPEIEIYRREKDKTGKSRGKLVRIKGDKE